MALSPDVLLDIALSTYAGRHRYTNDPGPVIAELQRMAGPRTDVLAKFAGIWGGFFDGVDERVFSAALREVDGAAPWVEVGRYRRGIPNNGATPLPPTYAEKPPTNLE
jgi:hypothetical protein